MRTLRAYYYLTKPGIIRGNAIAAIAGFALAAQGSYDVRLLGAMLAGLSCVIASGCVVNNYIDRHIDARMERTKKRGLVTGRVSARGAWTFAALLLGAGGAILGLYTNSLTLLIALFGYAAYVVLYGIWKRRSPFGTVVGSISGAVPPVVGYTAVSNRLDTGALLLFVILVCWQMPHFYAIAIYRMRDYAAAGIPVLPIKKGLHHTKVQTAIYTIGFIVSVLALTALGYTGISYAVIMAIVGLLWLRIVLRGFAATDEIAWARQTFRHSLLVLSLFSVLVPLDAVLP